MFHYLIRDNVRTWQPLLTAYRELSAADMIANGLGGLIGYALGAIIMYAVLRPSQ